MPSLRHALAGFGSALLALGSTATLRADFTAAQTRELAQGSLVVEESDYTRGYHRYVGGVSYLMVEKPVERLSAAARDVNRIRAILPAVSSAKLTRVSPGGRAWVRIEHRVGPFSGGYTLIMEFSDGGRFGRFWLDPAGDNDLNDLWGFIRLTPIAGGNRTLVTYAILFDLGDGVLRSLFEGTIRSIALSIPRRLANVAY